MVDRQDAVIHIALSTPKCSLHIKREPAPPTRRFSYGGWCTAHTYFIALQRPVFLEPSRTIKSFWTRTLMALSTVLVDMLS